LLHSFWTWSNGNQKRQTLVARIRYSVNDAGRRDYQRTSGFAAFLISDLKLPNAFEDEIELIGALVCVHSLGLVWFQAVEPNHYVFTLPKRRFKKFFRSFAGVLKPVDKVVHNRFLNWRFETQAIIQRSKNEERLQPIVVRGYLHTIQALHWERRRLACRERKARAEPMVERRIEIERLMMLAAGETPALRVKSLSD
jgi:hypothetical protein